MINFNDIPRNIFYYILFSKNTGNVIFIFLYDLLLLLLFHIGRHQRGTRADSIDNKKDLCDSCINSVQLITTGEDKTDADMKAIDQKMTRNNMDFLSTYNSIFHE